MNGLFVVRRILGEPEVVEPFYHFVLDALRDPSYSQVSFDPVKFGCKQILWELSRLYFVVHQLLYGVTLETISKDKNTLFYPLHHLSNPLPNIMTCDRFIDPQI